jgi:glycosyltransferase involved in cell wall biosynthesis
MKFTVVMPSYMGTYRTAAKNREQKILRAVDSVLCQTYGDFELIVVADGCPKTMDILKDQKDYRVRKYLIEKDKIWGGAPRNTGIELAKGEYIVYLDIDDIYGKDHLKNISQGLNGFDWVWFDDIRYSPKLKEWYDNPCNINRLSQHGTSNICHKSSLPYRWNKGGYGHDYYFIAYLKQNRNFAKITGGEYYVCHIPGIREGYDL